MIFFCFVSNFHPIIFRYLRVLMTTVVRIFVLKTRRKRVNACIVEEPFRLILVLNLVQAVSNETLHSYHRETIFCDPCFLKGVVSDSHPFVHSTAHIYFSDNSNMDKNEKYDREKEKEKGLLPVGVTGKIKPKKLIMKKSATKQQQQQEDETFALPPDMHNRLQKLFSKIEKEFERLHHENLTRKFQ